MSRTYKDTQARSGSERRVYRCIDDSCSSERFAVELPAGWSISKQQLPGRHTVWCVCSGCSGEGSRS